MGDKEEIGMKSAWSYSACGDGDFNSKRAGVWVGRCIYFECLDFERSVGHPEIYLMDSMEYSPKTQ